MLDKLPAPTSAIVIKCYNTDEIRIEQESGQ